MTVKYKKFLDKILKGVSVCCSFLRKLSISVLTQILGGSQGKSNSIYTLHNPQGTKFYNKLELAIMIYSSVSFLQNFTSPYEFENHW